MRVAIIQVCSDDDLSGNLSRAEAGVAEAAERGAGFVSLPENFAYMCREGRRFPCAQWPKGEIVEALREWSARYGVWLLGGTFPEAIPGDDRVFNSGNTRNILVPGITGKCDCTAYRTVVVHRWPEGSCLAS